jgi:ADP-heptose:LPS heptosyltransferase
VTRRVLVVRLDSMGDVLVCGPAVRAIAELPAVDIRAVDRGGEAVSPQNEIWMLVSRQGAPAARLLPGVAHVLVWDCPWITVPSPDATPESLTALTRLIAQARPDAAVILTSFHQSPLPLALMLRLAGVARITGASVDFAGSLLDDRLRPGEDLDEDQPEPVRALQIASAAGFPLPAADDGRLSVHISPAAWERAAAALAPLQGRPYVVLHPGAAVPAREWPARHFMRAAELLAAEGIGVVVTGSRTERDLTIAVAGSVGLDLGGRCDLESLAAVLAGAGVVLVGNTGPAHLAAAVGTAVVSLFSPVVPAERWAPYGVPVRMLGDQSAACRSTRARVCPVAGHPCLTDVTPEAGVAACLELNEQRIPARRFG